MNLDAKMGHKETRKEIVPCNNQLEEDKKIGQLRAIVENKDPCCNKEMIGDQTLRRFLRARDHDVDRASVMLMENFRWRREFVPKGSIAVSEVANQTAQNKVFMQGMDRRGCPVLVIVARKHFSSKGGGDEFKRFVVFVLDTLCSRLPKGQEEFTIIGDLQGYSYSNSDVRGYISALTTLQDHYPEQLRKLYLVNVPYVFMALYKIVQPFIDKRSREKIIFVENKKLKSTLTEDIDECQLPEIYGGKLQLVPIQDA